MHLHGPHSLTRSRDHQELSHDLRPQLHYEGAPSSSSSSSSSSSNLTPQSQLQQQISRGGRRLRMARSCIVIWAPSECERMRFYLCSLSGGSWHEHMLSGNVSTGKCITLLMSGNMKCEPKVMSVIFWGKNFTKCLRFSVFVKVNQNNDKYWDGNEAVHTRRLAYTHTAKGRKDKVRQARSQEPRGSQTSSW